MWKRIVTIAGVLMLAGGAAFAVTMTGTEQVTVEHVVDGDTIDVVSGGETTRVRLLNIDTPEIGRDGALDECYAQEAKAHLEELLPRGTTVTLEYDVEEQDKYGRDLAGVFKNSTFINEEMVKEGLARAVLFEPNRKFYGRIAAAEAAPKADGAGVFSADGPCLFPTQNTRELYISITDKRAELDALDVDEPDNARRAATIIARLNDDSTRLKLALTAEKPFYSTDIEQWLEQTHDGVRKKEKQAIKTLDREAKRMGSRRQQKHERTFSVARAAR